jgi:hypothetical protein
LKIAIVILGVFTLALQAGEPMPPLIADRLTEEWIKHALREVHGDQVIIFDATSKGGNDQLSEIRGEILILSPKSAIACSHVTIRKDQITVEGLSHSFVSPSQAPPWNKLLPHPK